MALQKAGVMVDLGPFSPLKMMMMSMMMMVTMMMMMTMMMTRMMTRMMSMMMMVMEKAMVDLCANASISLFTS